MHKVPLVVVEQRRNAVFPEFVDAHPVRWIETLRHRGVVGASDLVQANLDSATDIVLRIPVGVLA